jgi:cell division protein FtsN
MSLDYKQIAQPRPDSPGSFLIGLFFGFLLGLGVAAGIAVYFFKTPAPFSERARAPDKAPPVAQNLPDASKAAPLPAEEKPRFDFYRILPGREEPVTDRQLREAAKHPGASKDVYFVQAGSFQNPADADSVKARLALMGLEATVEPADLAEKGVWYRVRLGPFKRIEEINRVRQQLAQNGVEASLVRVKDVPTN